MCLHFNHKKIELTMTDIGVNKDAPSNASSTIYSKELDSVKRFPPHQHDQDAERPRIDTSSCLFYTIILVSATIFVLLITWLL